MLLRAEGPAAYRGDPKMGFYGAYFRNPDGHMFGCASEAAGRARPCRSTVSR